MTRICLIAGNRDEAEMWAAGQNLETNQWFYPDNLVDLLFETNFHVIVIGSAGSNVPSDFFEKVYALAMERGKIGRRQEDKNRIFG